MGFVDTDILISVIYSWPLRFLLAQLAHVYFNSIWQYCFVVLVIDEAILLEFVSFITSIGIAFYASFIVVFPFISIGINITIGTPKT